MKQENRHNWRKKACALALSALLVATMGLQGCKYTDVLTEHIEDETLGVLDPDADPVYKDVPGAPEDPTRTSSQLSDSERIDEQTQTLPDYDQNQDNPEETDNREQREDTANEQNATEGDEDSENDGENQAAGTGDGTTENTAGTGDGNGTGTTEEPQTSSGDENKGDGETGGGGGTGQVYDTTGTNVELPEDVGSIAAAGQYATIVQMLAGEGGLVAADSAWIESVQSYGMFPGEGVEALDVCWTGDDETGYTADIDALIAADPDVVLADGVKVMFSEEETARLLAAGVSVVTVPELGKSDTPDESITSAVSVVGELLKSANTQLDTTVQVNNYLEMHSAAIDDCLNANGGYSYKMNLGTSYRGIYQGTSATGTDTTELSSNRYTTVFIDAWTYDITSTSEAVRRYGNASLYLDGATLDSSDGAGLSATNSSQNFILMDYYLQVSGVVNNSYEGAKPVSSGAESTLPYLIVPGDTRNLVTSTTSAASRTTPSALWYSPSSISLGSTWVTAGDSSFSIVLTRTEEMAQSVVTSANKVNGLYNTGLPYTVRVVPSGFSGSWADGTIESFLLAPWTYCIFQGGGDLETATTYVNDFYSTFYRCGAANVVQDYDTAYAALCPTS